MLRVAARCGVDVRAALDGFFQGRLPDALREVAASTRAPRVAVAHLHVFPIDVGHPALAGRPVDQSAPPAGRKTSGT